MSENLLSSGLPQNRVMWLFTTRQLPQSARDCCVVASLTHPDVHGPIAGANDRDLAARHRGSRLEYRERVSTAIRTRRAQRRRPARYGSESDDDKDGAEYVPAILTPRCLNFDAFWRRWTQFGDVATKAGNKQKSPWLRAFSRFQMVGHPGIEPGTSCLSSMRSNQLS